MMVQSSTGLPEPATRFWLDQPLNDDHMNTRLFWSSTQHDTLHEAPESPLAAAGIGRLSVSIGLAVFQGPADTLDALLARADAALYRAKAQGRDRVEVA